MEYVHPIKTQEEIDILKEYFAKRSKRDLLLFVIGINSGLRISDILRLRVKDVLDDEYNIRRSCEIREKKTGKLKQFALNKKIREILLEYFETDADYKINEENFLFPSRKGINKPITRYHAWRILSGAAKEVGIKERIGTHTLRKTFDIMLTKGE